MPMPKGHRTGKMVRINCELLDMHMAALGASLDEVAAATGFSSTTVRRIRAGIQHEVSRVFVHRFAAYYRRNIRKTAVIETSLLAQ